jgi:hypothetical protein
MAQLRQQLPGFLIATVAILVGATVATSVTGARCIEVGLVGRLCAVAVRPSLLRMSPLSLAAGLLAAIVSGILLLHANRVAAGRRSRPSA